jgi:hypothetical protein
MNAALAREFTGLATPLADSDLEWAARTLETSVAVIQAVCEVEAPGGGFLDDRRPKILFEAHVFSRITKGRFDRSHPMLSSPSWNRSLYGREGAWQHERLGSAIALDRSAALKSASWGKFQVLGKNHAMVGFSDVESFVKAQCESERRHLEAFVNFVQIAGLADELRGRDWAGFAAGYNGAGYAANAYDLKLAAAFARAAARAQRAPDHPENKSRDRVRAAQAGLNVALKGRAGFMPLAVDGWIGPKTTAALMTFQKERGIVSGGVLDPATEEALGIAR